MAIYEGGANLICYYLGTTMERLWRGLLVTYIHTWKHIFGINYEISTVQVKYDYIFFKPDIPHWCSG